YRADLARAVRPVRPRLAAGDRPARLATAASETQLAPHGGSRPAPLVLVSEQRIDRSAGQPVTPARVTPVRPRRVSRGAVMATAGAETSAREEAMDEAMEAELHAVMREEAD